MSKIITALVVFSGGLDSILAVKTLQEQNIKIIALSFESNFYDAKIAKKSAGQLRINLKIVNIQDKVLELTKNPPNGYGKNMNPCIDCHGLMFRIAGEMMQKENFDILATGEVLGQRPFSQNKDALKKVQILAGVDILRPLSAKLLDETVYEKNHLVDRIKLYSVKGRSRNMQTELAKKYSIDFFPSPAGGCLLTDPSFGSRLRIMFDNWPDCRGGDIELLKNGRVMWLDNINSKKIIAIIGRNKKDNEELEKLAQTGDIVLQLKEINGPITLIRGLDLNIFKNIKVSIPEKYSLIDQGASFDEQIIKQLSIITGYYAVKARGKEVIIEAKSV